MCVKYVLLLRFLCQERSRHSVLSARLMLKKVSRSKHHWFTILAQLLQGPTLNFTIR